MMRFPGVLLPLLLLTTCIALSGEDVHPASRTITAAEILERNVIATGGWEALERLQSMVVQGDLVLSRSRRGEFSFFYQAPSIHALQLRIKGIGTLWAGDHERIALSRSAPDNLDLMRMDNTEMEPLNKWAILIDLVNLVKKQVRDTTKVELLGRTEIDGRCALGLSFTPARGYRFMRFYDCETFLLVRMDQVEHIRRFRNGPETEQVVRSYFTYYEESFGLKLPRVIRISRPQGDSELKLSNTEANVKIDDSVFR